MRALFLLSMWLALPACAGEASRIARDSRNHAYELEMATAIDRANTCAEAIAAVAGVRARWVEYWPDAPAPNLTCHGPKDGGANGQFSDR